MRAGRNHCRSLRRARGAGLVDSLEELGDVIGIALRAKPVERGGTQGIGCFKALVLDFAEQIALETPMVGTATEAKLRPGVIDFIGVSNPMDLGAGRS